MTQQSKFLSYVLRHKPEEIGLGLDRAGWVPINELLKKLRESGRAVSRNELLQLVDSSDKKRFTISADGQRIRAAQGHSINVDLGLPKTEPPMVLYHGTSVTNLEPILLRGLEAGKRRQVHLSLDTQTAIKVGRRHGKPVVLKVDAEGMHSDGYRFVRADNGVWLTDHVPQYYLKQISTN